MNVAREPSGLPEARRAAAVGTFDGVHRGHLRVIDAARRAVGDGVEVIVAQVRAHWERMRDVAMGEPPPASSASSAV